jgi:hypothetical protein
MSSITPIESPVVLPTINGRIQLSIGGGSVGIIVERAGLFGGTLLSRAQAEVFAREVLKRLGFNEAVDK